MKINRILASLLLCASVANGYAQGLANLKLTEVVVDNADGLVDEYDNRSAWIEIGNTSWSTINVGGCYITNDRSVLNPDMSAPQRIARMSQIPRGDERTSLAPKSQIVIFADGRTNMGTLHAGFRLQPGKDNFIALYEANGTVLIDSVTVPASLPENCSWALFENGWRKCEPSLVTPDSPNDNTAKKVDKIAEFKEHDPHGFVMTILGMGIVFSGLIVLSILFVLFGNLMRKFNGKKAVAQTVTPQKPVSNASVDVAVAAMALHEAMADADDAVKAVIAMALYEYEHDMHDEESGVITILPTQSPWPQRGIAMENRFNH
mgnify:FL=1